MHNFCGMARMLLNGESRSLTVCAVNVPTADGKKVVDTPTPATNSMPRQRLRCVPGMLNSSEVKVFHPT